MSRAAINATYAALAVFNMAVWAGVAYAAGVL